MKRKRRTTISFLDASRQREAKPQIDQDG